MKVISMAKSLVTWSVLYLKGSIYAKYLTNVRLVIALFDIRLLSPWMLLA
ncbi:hypothetical protein SLEP1_g15539 [Rubroshorea leprosula]|uniref:Uncharacterized protein n=1 Tax=Rubroshorea leprosula TaxID=152421 RepID=A0AAV5IZC9_9ROSI|nr:hypothetical protein SLEP1_g15539 [Rubroshorea leprosula]